MPAGSAILGVDPASCNPADWDGGAATAQVTLPAIYQPTVLVLKVSWPDQGGKGVHSPEKGRKAMITIDGRPLLDLRTLHVRSFGNYYAAEREPILTTIVLTQTAVHSLRFSVPARTAWDMSAIELYALPMTPRIRGIGYSPYRDCQTPTSELQPSAEDIEEDLFRLFHTTNAIRTYAATGSNRLVPAIANRLGLPVYAGAWLDKKPSDEAELQALITLANTTNLAGAIIGNEFYLRNNTDADLVYLREQIVRFKAAIQNKSLPVMTAEIDGFMFDWEDDAQGIIKGIKPKYKPILDEVDIVLVHIYPFWNQLPIEGAAEYTVRHYNAIRTLINQVYPGKRVVIGETGWPSGVYPNGRAIPSRQNQLRYLREFLTLAEQNNVDYMYFDAFDELWKIEEPGLAGQNWGYSYSDRSAKYFFNSVLLPAEHLPPPQTSELVRLYMPFVARSSARTFPVYTEWLAEHGSFVPSGWMGDIKNMELFECDRTDPHSGDMAVRASFKPHGPGGWAGIYWQYPENNWGTIDQSIDLRWANKLTFWAKGSQGGERVQFFVGGIGTARDPYPESLRPAISTGFIQLGTEWRQYTIDLRGADLTRVIGGFGWSTDTCANPNGATFYLDDISFQFDPNMPPPTTRGSTFPIYTDAAAVNNHYVPSLWMGDGSIAGRVSLTECWTDNPHSGQTSIRVAYTRPPAGGQGWAGAYWVHPAENIGDRPGGYNLTGVKRLTFWARSDTPDTTVTFLVGGVGYATDYRGVSDCNQPQGAYPDSLCPAIKQTERLTSTWALYTIDLSQLSAGQLRSVVGGFGWVSNNTTTFYLDDIVYEFGP